MTPAAAPTTPPAQEGFVLIEIIVSALVLAIAAGGVVSLLNATGRAGAEERNRSAAYAIAQEDQARLRSTRLSSLNHLNENRPVTLNGTTFTVNSTGVFVNDSTGSTTCATGAASADYVVVGTKVTWPGLGSRPAPEIKSILSPANGSLDPTHGTLSVTVKNAAGVAIPGIGLSGSGPTPLTGTTDSTGCAMFADIPAGTYTITPTGIAAGLVDQDGKTAGPFTVGVVGGSTNSAPRLYDLPGKIEKVTFRTRKADGTIGPSKADSIVVFNTGMTTAKVFGSPGGTRVSEIPAPSLFPFAAPNADTVYAGSCGTNNPNPKGETNPPGALAMASVQITPSGSAPTAPVVQLPALYVYAWTGKNAANPGSAFGNADVWIRDEKCFNGTSQVTRRYATEPSGLLVGTLGDPGLPWGTYEVCVDSQTGGSSSSRKGKIYKEVHVESLTSGPSLNFYLGSGSGSESAEGKCE